MQEDQVAACKELSPASCVSQGVASRGRGVERYMKGEGRREEVAP